MSSHRYKWPACAKIDKDPREPMAPDTIAFHSHHLLWDKFVEWNRSQRPIGRFLSPIGPGWLFFVFLFFFFMFVLSEATPCTEFRGFLQFVHLRCFFVFFLLAPFSVVFFFLVCFVRGDAMLRISWFFVICPSPLFFCVFYRHRSPLFLFFFSCLCLGEFTVFFFVTFFVFFRVFSCFFVFFCYVLFRVFFRGLVSFL